MSVATFFQNRARTKIVATVGPACRAPEMLAALVAEGVDVFRLNAAHGDLAAHEENLHNIRRVAAAAGRPLGVLMDLAGPKLRLGELLEDPLPCPKGSLLTFVRGERPARPDELTSNYTPLVDELMVGDRVLLADGVIALEVLSKTADAARCRVTEGGEIRGRQGINLPGVRLSIPALGEKDVAHAIWAARQGVDFVSLSFVRAPEEVQTLKDLLRAHGSHALAIAKIEKREALDQLEAIVRVADGVMVARGDLGVEIDVARTPVEQKRVVEACQRYRKPVIVATQMLDSMQHSRRPTRAEATDVANAILDGADACMLSGETAIGEYPRETVAMMNRIMLHTEELLKHHPSRVSEEPARNVHPLTPPVVQAAALIARQVGAKLVVIATRSGGTARIKAKQRDFIPTIGVSDSETTLRQMSLFWGVHPLAGAPIHAQPPQLRRYIGAWGISAGVLAPGDRVVFVTGSEVVPAAHNVIVVHEVEEGGGM